MSLAIKARFLPQAEGAGLKIRRFLLLAMGGTKIIKHLIFCRKFSFACTNNTSCFIAASDGVGSCAAEVPRPVLSVRRAAYFRGCLGVPRASLKFVVFPRGGSSYVRVLAGLPRPNDVLIWKFKRLGMVCPKVVSTRKPQRGCHKCIQEDYVYS